MRPFVKEQGIPYPVAVDKGTTTESFRVDSYPDYYLIDRAGKLRVADLANRDLDRAVKVLLAEKAPVVAKATKPLEEQDAETVLSEAIAEAKRSKRNVLVHVGGPG